MTDLVNHPAHYKTESGLEAITVLEAFFPKNPWLWTATKYLLRCGKKDDPRQEIRKCIWYLQRYLEWLDKRAEFGDTPEPYLIGQ